MRLLMLWAMTVACTLFTSAQEIRVKASAPEVVAVGQQFRLVYEINTREGKFVPPPLDDFEVLMGPSTSYSQSTQIINGKISSQVSYTYTYILAAMKEGEYTLPPATLQLKKKTVQSDPLKITVVASGQQNQAAPAQPGQPSTQTPVNKNKDLFVRLLVNKKEVYLGEPVAVTLKIYSRVNLTGIEEVKLPGLDGFLKQDIPTPQLKALQREYIDGELYGTGVMARYLLFPQKTGKIEIDPVQVNCLVQKRVRSGPGGFFDDFFDSYQNVRQPVLSGREEITVKPLPPGAPEGFKGAVGSFGLDISTDKNTLQVNDAVNLTVTVSGRGNLKLIEPPVIDFPPDFEVYDPKITADIKNTVNGATGSKKFEYIMIPRHAGKFRISPVKFVYFDPQSEAYKTLRTPAVNIEVARGEDSGSVPVVSGLSKEALRVLGKDIRYIYNQPFKLRKADHTLLDETWYGLTWIILTFLFVLLFIVHRVLRKQRDDVRQLKNRRANRVAKKRLRTAGTLLAKGEETRFHEEILRALWGYLSDKLGLPVSDLSREKAGRILKSYHVPDEQVERLIFVLDQCEFARYAPEGKKMQNDKLYREAIQVITELEQKL